MKHILKILINFAIVISEITTINDDKLPLWFMHDKYLYYVNREQNFTSNYTQKECSKRGMLYTISQANAQDLLPHLKQVYSDLPALWTYNNEYFNKVLNIHIKIRSCFGLDANTGEYKPKFCTEKLGFICKIRMKSAIIYYENSVLQVQDENIKKYCDPQANNINDLVNSCLIIL